MFDNQHMSSFGIGLTVFIGFIVGIPLVRDVPGDVPFDLLLMGSAMWGMIVGFVYRMYEIAIAGFQPPNADRR